MKIRFQFRLRTLFIVVTLAAAVCGYIGHEYSLVRARLACAKSDADPVLVFFPEATISISLPPKAEDEELTMIELPQDNPGAPRIVPKPLPWIRTLLGDRPWAYIGLPADASERDRQRIARLFPEAQIATRSWNQKFLVQFPTTRKPQGNQATQSQNASE